MLSKRLINLIIAVVFVVAIGIIGYILIEGWSFLDAWYMTIISLATVGFMEVNPLSPKGRIFTIFLILGGMGILLYGVSTVVALFVEGELSEVIRRKRMQKNIDEMRDHYIVCGTGKTAQYVIEEMQKTHKDFVVIENDKDKIKMLEEQGTLYVEGDATHDAVLTKAGIEGARGLITVLHTDAENLFVVLTAKGLNRNLKIISRVREEESVEKIKRAGADSVVMPDFIGGMRMVSEMIRPSIVTFLDVMLREKDKTIRVEEIDIPSDSRFIGKSLEQIGILEREGLTVVALKDSITGSYKFNPSRTTELKMNDVIIVMGDVKEIDKLREKCS